MIDLNVMSYRLHEFVKLGQFAQSLICLMVG